MNTPYLVQRLKKPVNYVNPFDGFGAGGLKNGGIKEDAMTVLRKVMTFDYMGAAEFEWGAIPKALQVLNDAPELATHTIHHVTKPNIYLIALPKDIEEVIEWVESAADGVHSHLKEHLGFREALAGPEFSDTVGWLKIEEDRHCESPFMFFIDKQMFDDTLTLFKED